MTSITQASPAASGTFDLNFNGQTYSSIPVDISPTELANRLQASPDFGFLNINRLRDCTGYSYTIEWLTNGGQKTSISISNTNNVMPLGTNVTASFVQRGGVLFSPLPGDMTRTYHTTPQVSSFLSIFSFYELYNNINRSKFLLVVIFQNVLTRTIIVNLNGYRHKLQRCQMSYRVVWY